MINLRQKTNTNGGVYSLENYTTICGINHQKLLLNFMIFFPYSKLTPSQKLIRLTKMAKNNIIVFVTCTRSSEG